MRERAWIDAVKEHWMTPNSNADFRCFFDPGLTSAAKPDYERHNMAFIEAGCP
jgi:hypothetical protein